MRPTECHAAAEDRLLVSSGTPEPADHRDAHAQVHELYRADSPRLVRQLARRTGCRELAREPRIDLNLCGGNPPNGNIAGKFSAPRRRTEHPRCPATSALMRLRCRIDATPVGCL